MKKLILFATVFTYTIFSFAQDKVSYSIDKYYYAPLNKEIASLKTWLTDSMFLKDLEPNVGGFGKKVDIPFTEIATKIESNGFVDYLLHVESINGTRAGISVVFNLGIGDTIFVEKLNGRTEEILYPGDNCEEEYGCRLDVHRGNEMIIRFRTTEESDNESKIIIKVVHYTFVENNYQKNYALLFKFPSLKHRFNFTTFEGRVKA